MKKVEGEWSGYTSAQRRVVHRMYCSDKFAEKIKALGYGIRFTDGTYLVLNITKVARRGKDVIRGYDDLIYKCINAGGQLGCRTLQQALAALKGKEG